MILNVSPEGKSISLLFLFQFLLRFLQGLALLIGQLIFRRMPRDRLREDADAVARIEARDDDAVALLGQECRGEALVASAAGALEGIEAYGMDRLDALLQAILDGGQIAFQFGLECLQFLDIVRGEAERVRHMLAVYAYEEASEFGIHHDDEDKEDDRHDAEYDDGDEKRIGEDG